MKRGAVAVAVHRLRGRLQVLLRDEAQRTIGPDVDAEGELRALLETLATR
jgi:hypothetical protein